MSRDEQALKRLRWMRAATVAAPWVVILVFAAFRMAADAPRPVDPFPPAERDNFTMFWFVTGGATIVGWVVARFSRSANMPTWIALVCYPLAMWVALFGAAAVGRGAAVTWFVLPYAWAIAVVYALFPLRE